MIEPFEYMRDSEHVFYATQIAELTKTGLYINVETKEREATYTLKFVGRKES